MTFSLFGVLQYQYAKPMIVRTLQTGHYRNCKIYYRQIHNDFEYLAVINGEIYSARVTIRKHWWQILLLRDFNKQQLVNATNYIARLAETTVDTVLDQPKE